MAAIKTLLNPVLEHGKRSLELEPPPPPLPSPAAVIPYYREHSRSPPVQHKKQKVSKDAAIFNSGTIRGECRYPPHEEQDELLAAQHQQFEITPLGRIAECPRHIPYNSEKKAYLQKTGRDSFEVFHYEFKVPGDEKVYVMMWDYNIGLVRTTPLFRCNGYSKTTPAKMLSRNKGLRDICHSITGGALVAQGYWMPYAAARASAATFCWKIRYALTPVFGTEFPAMCIPPDGEHFGEMVIDPAITQECREQAEKYRALEPAVIYGAVVGSSSCSAASSAVSSPISPSEASTPPTTYRQAAVSRQVKALRPKGTGLGVKLHTTTTTEAPNDVGGGSRSGYSTDDNYSLGSVHSLALSLTPPPLLASSATASNSTYRNTWTAANTPRSVPMTGLDSSCSSRRLPSPREILDGISDVAARSHTHEHSHHRQHNHHRLPGQHKTHHQNANANANASNKIRSRSHSASSESSLSSLASAVSSSLSSSPAVSPKTCRPRNTAAHRGVAAAADEDYDGDSSSDGAALHAGSYALITNNGDRQATHGTSASETRTGKSKSKDKNKDGVSKRELAAALGGRERRGGLGLGLVVGAAVEPNDEKAAYLLMSLKVKDPEPRVGTGTGDVCNGQAAAGTGTTAAAAIGLTMGKKRRASA